MSTRGGPARAGPSGRGFAVVAQEVRALAQRSADAAKEIKTLISSSTQQVGQGVSLVGQTGEALERIAVQISQINGVVSEIAASAQEQATGLHQVNTAVNQMDQVTQQNAALVEQMAAAASSLKAQAGDLVKVVAQFKLGDDQAAFATAAAPVAPARRPMPRMVGAAVGARRLAGGSGQSAVAKPRLSAESRTASHAPAAKARTGSMSATTALCAPVAKVPKDGGDDWETF